MQGSKRCIIGEGLRRTHKPDYRSGLFFRKKWKTGKQIVLIV
jgi:hypothetical protein